MKSLIFFKKGGFILPALLVAGFFVFHFAFAYDSKNAHRGLTYEAAEFYNMSLDSRLRGNDTGKLAQDDIDYLMQGAQEEDTPPRWINHFYDPTTGQGWTAEKLGGIDAAIIKVFSSLALSARPPLSAKNWVKNRSAQADYWRYAGDQTWQRAIELYAAGDKKNAFIALGHVLHLIEDMTVPDHTRGDTHAGLAGDTKSSYENYAKEITAGKNTSLDIAEKLKNFGRKPLDFPILENYIEANAKYSHNNFFSDDTMVDGISPPTVNKKIFGSEEFIYVKNNDDIYAVVKHPRNNENIEDYIINDPLILSAYWERLSKQAVVSGAGVINLFFKEAEEYKKLHPAPTSPNPSSGRRGGSVGLISPFGELVKLNNFFVQTFSGARQFVQSIMPQAGKTETIVSVDELTSGLQKENPPPPSSPLDYQEGGNLPPSPPFTPSVATSNPPVSTLTPSNSPLERGRIGEEEKIYISHVIDGDTVTLNNGKDVRLIGMDTPELGDECAAEAKEKLSQFVLGKYVFMEKDKSETDKYGRLLRYIYIDSVMINAEMTKEGYAKVMSIPPDTKYYVAFKTYAEEAKFFKRGCLWGGVGGAEEEIHNSSLPPLTLRGGEENKGPYYGGSSWAGAPEQSSQNLPPPPAPPQAGGENNTPTPLTDFTATSTPPGTSTTSTPETASSTPSLALPPNTGGGNGDLIKIIINEIQIAGQIADDEFIELYNPNNDAVDITGWNLSKNKSGTESNLVSKFSASTTIPANAYFLIVSQKSTSTPADTTYSGSSFYISNDSAVLLKNKNNQIIDKVGMGEAQDYETAPTSNPPKNQSITRQNFADTDNNQIDFIIATSTPQGTSSTPLRPEDYAGQAPSTATSTSSSPPEPVVCETPSYDGHKNYEGTADRSKTTPFPQIPGNTTITLASDTTYYIAASGVSPKVPASSRLIIPEGVVIKFGPWKQDTWLLIPATIIIEGDLEINGTKANPVVFTTFRDDAYGAKINMSTSTPAPSDWGYVEIDSRKGKNIKIAGAKFLYGGGNNAAALIVNGDADVDISDTEFLHNRAGIFTKFIYFAGGISVSNGNFEYNRLLGLKITDIKNTSVNVAGNNFKCNGFGRGNTAVGALDIATTDQYWSGASTIIMNNNFWGDYEKGANYNKSYHLGSDTNNSNLNAPNNFWGDASGPFHATANPEGKGSAVSDYINFSPWNTASAP